MAYKKNKIVRQAEFCKILMDILLDGIKQSTDTEYFGLEKHCRHQDDVKRLRRELLKLSKMLDPWEKEV